MRDTALLQMRNIRCSYGDVEVIKGVDFDLYSREIHAISGDHGSGKSTLVRIMSGVLPNQGGSIFIDGRPAPKLTPATAGQLGIGVVHQSEEIIPKGTLMDNVYLGRYPGFVWPRTKSRLETECRELFELYGFDEDPLSPAGELAPARRQLLSLLRILAGKAKILILDEISQKSAPEELQHIYRLLRICRDEGRGVVYVTSNIDEIFHVGERVTVLHKGHRRSTEEVSRVDKTRLINLAFSFAMDRNDSSSPRDHEVLLLSRYGRKIIDDFPQGMMIISPAEEIQDLNTAASRILDCDPDDIKGRGFTDYLKDLPLEGREEVLDCIQSRKPGSWQKLRFAQKILLKIRVTPLGDEGDGDRGVLLFLEDVSADYEAREYLQQAEKLVSTAELAAGVAHEVNNPLGIIQNYLDLLRLENLSDDSREYVSRIQSELTRIVEVISNLLSFSRAGYRPTAGLDPQAILNDVIVLLGHKLRKKNIDVKCRYRAGTIRVEAHENKLKQLFINLINNACDAVLSGGEIEIETRSRASQSAGEDVEISISDNGHGIPEDISEHIFAPFYTTKMTKTNTGLGLSICRHIVESYDGTIVVNSVPGERTTFVIRLPGV